MSKACLPYLHNVQIQPWKNPPIRPYQPLLDFLCPRAGLSIHGCNWLLITRPWTKSIIKWIVHGLSSLLAQCANTTSKKSTGNTEKCTTIRHNQPLIHFLMLYGGINKQWTKFIRKWIVHGLSSPVNQCATKLDFLMSKNRITTPWIKLIIKWIVHGLSSLVTQCAATTLKNPPKSTEKCIVIWLNQSLLHFLCPRAGSSIHGCNWLSITKPWTKSIIKWFGHG